MADRCCSRQGWPPLLIQGSQGRRLLYPLLILIAKVSQIFGISVMWIEILCPGPWVTSPQLQPSSSHGHPIGYGSPAPSTSSCCS